MVKVNIFNCLLFLKSSKSHGFLMKVYWLISAILSISIASCYAVDVRVVSVFHPNSSNPSDNSFETEDKCQLPNGSKYWCGSFNNVNVETPLYVIRNLHGLGNAEDGVFFRLPGRRHINVAHDSGAIVQLEMVFSDVGARYSRIKPMPPIHDAVVGELRYPDNSGTSCSSGGRNIVGSSDNTAFYWAFNLGENGGSCKRSIKTTLDGQWRVSELFTGFKLITPDPLKMLNGVYRGKTSFLVSPGGDISVGSGDYSIPVTMEFELHVVHAFSFKFPTGSERVLLAPKQGWSQWINGGQVPDSLSKEVPFTLSSSGGFKVWMRCEHQEGNGCGLKHTNTAETVPLDVSLTMPDFTINNKIIRNYPLSTASEGHRIDPPGGYKLDRSSRVNFAVKRAGVEKMVKQTGSQWKGGVTLIFDSEM